MLSRLIQLPFVCIRHTNSMNARQGPRQRLQLCNSVSQPPKFQARRDIKPSRNKIRNTTDDQDLWVLKKRVQSSVKGKDLSIWFMRHEDLSSAGILYIFSFTLYGKSNTLPSTWMSQSLMVAIRKTTKPPTGKPNAMHLADIHI